MSILLCRKLGCRSSKFANVYDPFLLQLSARNNQVTHLHAASFLFTNAAKLTLRIVWSLPRITLAELVYQAFEFQQIRHAEERTTLA
jgi:hypothetical protein